MDRRAGLSALADQCLCRFHSPHAASPKIDNASFIQLISGAQRGAFASILRGGLRAMSWGYGLATTIRNRMFDSGLRKVHQVPAPVISIGNLTAGGTGKTPFVAYVVDWLIQRGYRPGIVSRGYHAIESDSTGEIANDEKRVLEALCPGIPHLQNANRVLAASQAVSHHNCQMLVLDDGFQHRRLHRDLDIVLIDVTNPFGHGFVLPRGLMRESITGLKRADLLALTRCEQAKPDVIQEIKEKIGQVTTAPIIQTAFEPTRTRSILGAIERLSHLSNTPVVAFCGIGNPDGFWRTLESADIECLASRSFADHHIYSDSEIADLQQLAQRVGARCLVTTAKDLVKIPAEWCDALPVLAVDIELRVNEQDEDILFKSLMQVLNA